MIKPNRPAYLLVFIFSLFISFFRAEALTLDDLRTDPKLDPQKLISYFADFKFELREKTQTPEVFLASKTGDCDDFSTLAADLLKQRGYTTRLVAVSMDAGTHVICYVSQTKSYLDYNYRAERTVIESDGTLADIANKVAASFKSQWHSVSEFTFTGGVRNYLAMEFR